MQHHPPPNHELQQAYTTAHYCIADADACFTLRIGEPSPELAALLPDGAGAAFLTGWNPLGREQDQAANAAANAELTAQARRLGVRILRGTGRAPDGSWEEDSLLLLGIAAEDAMALALHHHQLAWVWVPPEAPVPVLVWTGLSPDGPTRPRDA